MNLDELATLAVLRRDAANGDARAIRLAADLSLGELAEVVGVTASTIMRWERGERAPRGAKALRYAEALSTLRRRTSRRSRRVAQEPA